MPEPVTETGFVPGDGIETGAVPIPNGSPDALEQGRDVVNALLGRISGFDPEASDESDSTGDSDTAAATETQGSTEATPVSKKTETPSPAESAPQGETITLTQQELDRRIQAETDRRESVRQNRQKQDARRTQNQTKLDRLKAAGDLEGFVAEYDAQQEEEKNVEQQAVTRSEYIRETAITFDTGILDPIANRLSVEDRQRLVDDINPVGIEGRAKFLSATVDLLIQNAKAEGAANAEKALRNNQAFRKQLLVENRETEEEPEQIPSRGRGSEPVDMNNYINRMLGRG